MSDYSITRMQRSAPATPRAVGELRRAAAAFAAEHGASDDVRHAVALGVSEAASNAVLHAYRGRDEPGEVHLDMFVEPGRLAVSVSDDGTGMRPRTDSPGLGVGLPLIAQMADDLQVRTEQGTVVLMTFSLATPAAA